MRTIRDERGIVVDWMLKIVVTLGVIAVVLYDVGAVAVNYFQLDSKADEIAIAASTGVQITQRDVERVAQEEADEADVKLVAAELTPEGQVVVRVKRRASTLVAKHISPLRSYTLARAEGRAGTQ